MLFHQRQQLGDRLTMTTQSKIGLDTQLDRLKPLLLQPPHLATSKLAVLEFGQRRATPQLECLRESCVGLCGI